MELLKSLCEINGVSGDERRVSDFISFKLKGPSFQSYTDKMGNLIVHKKGTRTPKTKVTLFAHTDEVGLIISYITKEGYLKFLTVGSIDQRVLLGKRVYIGINKIPGVIGIKAVHLQSEEQRKKVISIEEMYIDIGAKDYDEAKRAVNLGDYAAFESSVEVFGDNFICAKALDDRAGCAMIIEILKDSDYDISAVFSTGEEIGTRGAKVGASEVKQNEIAIVLEATTAADFDNVPENKSVTKLKMGPAISIIDRATFYSPPLVRLALLAANEKGIKHQIKESAAGANDAGAISLYGIGIRVLSISLPCRNLHSPSNVISLDDYKGAISLTKEIIKRLGDTGFEQ